MEFTKMKRRLLIALLSVLISVYSSVGKATNQYVISVKPGEYLLKTEILMPHLEESLRYATTKSQHCLSRENASTFFAVLSHDSFSNCSLVGKPNDGKYRLFDLVCLNSPIHTVH